MPAKIGEIDFDGRSCLAVFASVVIIYIINDFGTLLTVGYHQRFLGMICPAIHKIHRGSGKSGIRQYTGFRFTDIAQCRNHREEKKT